MSNTTIKPDLALEAWLHQSPGNDIYADSFRSGYAAGHDR
jgi:hypothetical protein